MKYKISPSRIGDYFVHNCDRYMVYDGLNNSDRKYIGWDEETDFNEVAKRAGEAWELEVVEKLRAAGEKVFEVTDDNPLLKGDKKKELSEKRRRETVEFLRKAEPGYIYQAVLYTNREFCEKYMPEVDTDQITWNDSMSDLIKVEFDEERKCPKFSVIDVKHAKRAKINHKVQIVVYIRMLETILAEHDIPGYVDDTTGYVWPFKAEEPKSFSTADIITFVDAYFNEALPNVIEKMRGIEEESEGTEIGERLDETLDYCLSQKCEWCGNLKHCTKWAEEHAPVLLMPYMTPRTQEYFMKNPDIPRTLDEFENYAAEQDNSDRMKEESGFLKNRLDNISDVLRAIHDRATDNRNVAYPKPVYNMDMPKYQDVKIVITAQRDVGLDKVYLYGLKISIFKSKNYIDFPVNANGFPEENRVFIAETPESVSANTREFVEYLYDFLYKVSQHNANENDWQRQLSVQGFVMDNYELFNLEEGLFDELLRGYIDEEYRNKLLNIIFWLQGERMITDSVNQAADLGVEIPVVVLSSAVGRLYVVPGYISNNLEDISKAFSESYDIELNRKYSNPLSNALKSEPINNIWFPKKDKDTPEDKTKNLEGLKSYVGIRLSVEGNIVSKLQSVADGHSGLKRNAPTFFLVDTNMSSDTRMAKLYIEQKYEQLLTFHEMRKVRMGDLEEAANDGKILKVRVVSEGQLLEPYQYYSKSANSFISADACWFRYEKINADKFFLKPFYWAITVETGDAAAGELAMLDERSKESLPDYSTDPRFPQRYFRLAYLDKMKYTEENGASYIYGLRMGHTTYQPGTILYIVEKFVDISGDRVADTLNKGLQNPGLIYPEGAYIDEDTGETRNNYTDFLNEDGTTIQADDYMDVMKKYITLDGMSFSASQKRAFDHMFSHNITLLLGPPGSGKTDFIARAILALCGLFKELYHYNMSVLVTANSHAAINNILEKLAEKIETSRLLGGVDEAMLPTLIKYEKFEAESEGDSDEEDENSGINGVDLYLHRRPKLNGSNQINNDPNILVYNEFTRDFANRRTNNPNYKINKPFVVGSTSGGSYKFNKLLQKTNNFGDRYNNFGGYDLIIIDEASQVKFGDAMIGMDLSKDLVRYLIVGDENQLSPIIKGSYNAPEDEPDIYGSVFRAYYDIAKREGLDYLCQLEENFRMNEILDRYPGEKIYDVDIVPGDGRNGYHAYRNDVIGDKIATQILTMDSFEDVSSSIDGIDDELMRSILDPDYPLVLVKLTAEKATDKQELELRLATEITKLLKEHMVDKDGNHYVTDEEFWGDANHKGAFAIISPHHEHINRLKDNISTELGMDRNKLYIGTVDKLQGQEREAVVVSYGVTNVEKAIAETEFIYSRNRLNVSITRGKKKTIVILADVLLDKPLELLDVDDEDTEKGISFMCDFEKFMKKTETDTESANPSHTEVDSAQTNSGNVLIEIMRKRVIFD
ncbi:AAA domain-containing protein [Lachnospiraceae bacterium NE2001]|nr:AAA domain-containing protein [Lachnospiraceae bacterium NE2001]